jgi:hypothetical protein
MKNSEKAVSLLNFNTLPKVMRSLLTLAVIFLSLCSTAQPVKVELAERDGRHVLLRGGEEYYIKGAGGSGHLDLLVQIGGNSIRTWSVDDTRKILDEAHAKGLTVMAGLWVGHERHGFDYDNEAAVRKQYERFEAAVKELKDHPAILLWGVGNEVDLFYSNTKVWYAVQDIAAMIHRVDPNHPTTTVTAGLDSMEVHLIKTRAPDIDILSVNTYGDLGYVPDNVRKWGWTGPYMISEWGPNGHWEVAKAQWGAPIEQSSEEKARSYRSRYVEHIESKRSDGMIGSYVFLWGQKQETTETWYGLFDAQGRPTRAIDMMELNWKGTLPLDETPVLESLTLSGNEVIPGSNMYYADDLITASLKASDKKERKLEVQWILVPEATNTKAGGDAESALSAVTGQFRNKGTDGVTVVVPRAEGGYRVFVKVIDQQGRVAYANIPFYSYPRPVGADQRQWVRWGSRSMDEFGFDPAE